MLLVVISFLLVCLAQPDFSLLACILTSALGYALFWRGMLQLPRLSHRFFLATLWFAGIQAVHLSWFASDRYVGAPIFLFLPILWFSLGACFGAISLLITGTDWSLRRLLGVAGLLTLIEWGRLFFFSGYSWNPAGLALSGSVVGMQMATIVGAFGLTFWVFVTNLLLLRWLYNEGRSRFFSWLTLALIPYAFGAGHLAYHLQRMQRHLEPPLNALLVQTAIAPEEKAPFAGERDKVLSPTHQWRRILALLAPHRGKPVDLIVLSEAAVPYGTELPLYPVGAIASSFKEILDSSFLQGEEKERRVGNSYWARSLANYFHADVIIGLEELEGEHAYNAAFFYPPDSSYQARYAKRVLVPMGEYIPFQWCKKILSKYGIQDSFTAGSEATVFEGKRLPMGVSICYEETFGHLMRENQLKGARLLVNLTNDVWYPNSRLPSVHYLHGRLRAVEGGVPLLRSCNTGVTCAVDSLGRLVGALDCERQGVKCQPDALYVSVPTYTYKTLYTRTGDLPIIAISGMCVLIAFLRKKQNLR